jgi:hypothetical protein
MWAAYLVAQLAARRASWWVEWSGTVRAAHSVLRRVGSSVHCRADTSAPRWAEWTEIPTADCWERHWVAPTVCWSAGQSGLRLAGRWGHGWAVLRVRSSAESTARMMAVLKAGLTAAC